MAQQLANDAQGQMQYVNFTLEEEVHGSNVMPVQEVPREVEVAPVLGAPHYVTGIINLRGNVVSVIDARTRFGLAQLKSTPLTRTIVIDAQRQIIGIPVDSVAEVVDIEMSEVETAPNVANEETSRYIDGVISRDDRPLILIDLNKLLTQAEPGEILSQ